MHLGIVTIKPMKKFENQFIGTRFVVIGIPIFPIQSYFFATEIVSCSIGFYWKQIFKTYLVFIGLLGTILCWAKVSEPTYFFYETPVLVGWIGLLLCIGFSIYGLFIIGKMSDEEKMLRKLYGKATRFNALPEYFTKKAATEMLISHKSNFEITYQMSWEEALKKVEIDKQHIPLLFVILGYSKRISDDDTINARYNKVLNTFKSMN